jgi:hypothetical protein
MRRYLRGESCVVKLSSFDGREKAGLRMHKSAANDFDGRHRAGDNLSTLARNMPMKDEFICDPLKPIGGATDAARMATGEPGLPRQFDWRGEVFDVTAVVRSWRETGPCTHGSDERYVKKHWYEIETPLGNMTIYFERQSRGGSNKVRWFLYSLREMRQETRIAHSPAPAGTSTPKS